MKVLHVVSSDRWTGASAPALAEVEALREQGVDASYAYVGGYTLEERLRAQTFARPLILRSQDPVSFFRSLEALSAFVESEKFDLVHAHLTYDHLLAARLRSRFPSLAVVRTFHAGRPLRRDPFTAYLLAATRGVAVMNETFSRHRVIASRQPVFTPPPVDARLFHPDGPSARKKLGLSASAKVAGVIGKVAPHRGFEEAFETFARLRMHLTEAKFVVIGRGPHRSTLEALSKHLRIDDALIWAGYHEEDLPEYFRALDVLLFTRTGSDEGHRAVSEALACGIPVASYPIPGVSVLLGDMRPRLIASENRPEALSDLAVGLMRHKPSTDDCVKPSRLNSLEASAGRLIALYQRSSV
jgi:glycosyltransferase involved in cell wall biosynthesis